MRTVAKSRLPIISQPPAVATPTPAPVPPPACVARAETPGGFASEISGRVIHRTHLPFFLRETCKVVARTEEPGAYAPRLSGQVIASAARGLFPRFTVAIVAAEP